LLPDPLLPEHNQAIDEVAAAAFMKKWAELNQLPM